MAYKSYNSIYKDPYKNVTILISSMHPTFVAFKLHQVCWVSQTTCLDDRNLSTVSIPFSVLVWNPLGCVIGSLEKP